MSQQTAKETKVRRKFNSLNQSLASLAFGAVFLPMAIAEVAPSGAADAADSEFSAADNRLQTLVVEAGSETTPVAALTTVDESIVQQDFGLSIIPALQTVPGVIAQNRYNIAQGQRLSIRGFGGRANFGVRGIQLRVDGVPYTLPDGQTEFDALDPELIASLQVLRGPAGSLYGNGAGGSVIVQSCLPPAAFTAALNLSGGQGDFQRQRLEVGGPVGEWRAIAAFNHLSLNGFRQHAAADSRLFNGRAIRPAGGGEFALQFSNLSTASEDPGGVNAVQSRENPEQASSRNVQFNAGEKISQQRLSMGWTSAAALSKRLGGRLSTNLYGGRRQFNNRLPFTGGGQVVFDRRFVGSANEYVRDTQLAGQGLRLTFGLDGQWQSDQRQRFNNNNGQRGDRTLRQQEYASNVALFAQQRLWLGSAYSLTTGQRFEEVRLAVNDQFFSDGDDGGVRRFSESNFNVGISRQWQSGTVAWLRVASSNESPTVTELANPQGGGFNPGLKSASTLSYEAGLDFFVGPVDFNLAVYHSRLRDELINFELANQPGRSFYRNAGQSRREGFELQLLWPFAQHWQLSVAYTAQRHRFTDYQVAGNDLSGNRIPGIPRQQLSAQLVRNWRAVTAQLNWRAFSDRQLNDRNTARAAGYGVLDLYLEWQLRNGISLAGKSFQLRPYLRIDNIFDQAYSDNLRLNAFGGRHFEQAPGVSFAAGFELRF